MTSEGPTLNWPNADSATPQADMPVASTAADSATVVITAAAPSTSPSSSPPSQGQPTKAHTEKLATVPRVEPPIIPAPSSPTSAKVAETTWAGLKPAGLQSAAVKTAEVKTPKVKKPEPNTVKLPPNSETSTTVNLTLDKADKDELATVKLATIQEEPSPVKPVKAKEGSTNVKLTASSPQDAADDNPTTVIPAVQAPTPTYDDAPTTIIPAAGTSGSAAKRPRWLIGALVAALVLLTAGVAGISYWAFGSSDFTVNSCVVRVDDAAQPADCTAKDAYEITKSVSSQDKCDSTQPVAILDRKDKGEEVLCLSPVKGKE
ncbi:MAG: hypothetical protein H0T78_03355 [Longispora sp.]|nr:hypothetical protein [Longispora sp. (in: high G+C Gram-positive bacteria)]